MKQITGILQSSMVEAIEWTGSGDGIIAAGIEVVFWQRKGRSWVMAWKSVADVPQVMVSATWSSEGFFATSAGCLLTSKVEKSLNLANGGCKHVSVYQHYGKSEVLKIQLYHPQPISSIRWRTSTSISLTKRNLPAWRDVLLTCCLDGTVRLWSDIDNGRFKKLIKGIDHKMSTSFQVVAIIEIEQCLNGILGMDVFIDWAGDMGSVLLTSEEDDYDLSSVSSRLDNIASCEWLISVGPVNQVTFWAIHCLDDVITFRSPRVTLWTKRNPADFQAGNFSFYPPLHPEEKPILVKVVVSRSQLFGPPVACSLLQLLPGNAMNWWHFYRPSIHDAEQKSLAQASKNRCLSHFASGVLNLDGHTSSILQLALHPYSLELELAVSLDSNGFLLFWSLPKNFNCTLEIQRYIHPTWKLLGKIRSQDLSVDLKYLTMAWLPLVLDDKPLLLLGYADGIDCFLINASDEVSILCCKIFSVLFAGHNHSEGSPDHIFATPFPSFSTSFLLYAVWMKEFKALSWKVVLQSEDLKGSSCAFSSDSESVSRPEDISGRISCSGRYSAAISPASWNFPDSRTSKIILCVSVVTLDHSILSNGKHVVSDNDSCGNSCSLMATGCSDGILQLWKLHSAKSSESECIPWFSVGEFAAHDGPVNAVSLSNCGSKVATVSIGAKNSNFTLHIWTPICFTGGGSFILEDVLLLSGPVVAFKWLTIGNGKLLLGVCMPNEFHIYCQRRAHNKFLESDDLEEKHAWCCISISHSHHPCHEFLWGPMLTPVLLHENKISIFSEWLCETEYKHIGDISSIVTDEYLCCDKSLENNGHGAKELKKCGEKETGIFSDVFSSGSFMKNNLDTRKRLHNLMDFVERLCRPLESYHPWALLQYLYRGNWKRAYIVLEHLVDSLKSSGASAVILESCNIGKSSYIPQIPLPKYLEGMTPRESESSTSQWGQGNSFVSGTFEKNAFLFGEETLKPPSLTAYPKNEIMGFIETLEMENHILSSLTSMERIQILTVLEVLFELGQTTLYESLDEPARRFWVAVRFQHFHFIRKAGKVADVEKHAIESWMIAWAFQSDSQGSLLNSVLSAEPSWLEMRNLGLGFWLTNASQLRARMEKLARLQYLKFKNPKDCALLYLALNRIQVLAGLFKISKDEKDKVLFKFLSRNFQEEKNKAAALKNAYVLMGRHQLELAVAFFLLGGEPFSAVTVCAKNLGDEQLALVICRLLEGFGGPLEHQLITNTLLPHAIENNDQWLSSLLEWSLGNYSESVKRLFEPSGNPTSHTSAKKCPHASLADPNIVLSKLATMMDSYSLDRFGLPLEALECFASYPMKGNADGSSEDIEAHDIFQVLLNPFSTSASTRTWLQEGFAYHLESNIRFSLAMQYISRLLREFPCWTYKNSAVFPELVKHDNSESSADEYQIEEFRHKLNLVILVFERRFSLKLIDLANMVLLFAHNNGLLFLGYQLMLGIVFWDHEVDNHHKTRHSTVHSVVLRLLVQAVCPLKKIIMIIIFRGFFVCGA
ncbi:hypothetical protein KSP39_PZI020173 [Platanthera zijinensis]|uniref:RAVE complex protein Rav1 C-terminal domain-containing protein n=1 Tax=Platanthera zijinensis TaxID=2320716 RepID=A0AAP0FXQ9_9ASPA